jgi:O-antigen ligase
VQAIALDHIKPMGDGAKLMRLSTRVQIVAGVGISLLLAGSFILTESLIPFGILIGAFAVFAIVRNPVASLLAFIVINVFLTLHGKDTGDPSSLDLALGIVIVLIMAYWLVRLRIFELESLSTSIGQLALALFAAWSVIVTIIGLFGDNNSFPNALREMLNLSPLLVLPIIYSRFIKLESPAERWLFITILIAGLIMVVWNFFHLRSNVLHAVYLFQTGRGNSDEMLSGFLVLVATSLLMTIRSLWKSLPAMILFLLGMMGVVISFARTLYVVVVICMAGVILLGDWKERWRGIRRLLVAGLIGIVAVTPVYFSSRIFRLLLMNYGLRFISTQHLGTDLALRMRYSEWNSEWNDILQNPILGYGFGTKFRIFDIVRRVHFWMPFSHNGYLYMIFKTGFIGSGLFFVAYFSFVIKGVQLLKSDHLSTHTRILVRATIGFLVAMLIYAYSAPVLDSKTDLIWVGFIIGYFLVIERNLKISLATYSFSQFKR